MATQRTGGDTLDRLGLGRGPPGDTVDRLDLGPAEPRRRPWVRAALLVALGALLGWGAHTTTAREAGAVAPPSSLPHLVAGSFEQNLRDPYGPEFTVSLFNTGLSTVQVLNVAPMGWRATTPTVSIPPGGSVELPVDVAVDCGAISSPTQFVEVRVAAYPSTRTVQLQLPQVPAALDEVYWRRCSQPFTTRPSLRDLLGTWIVEDGGPGFTGKLVFSLHRDGSYQMGTGTHPADGPGAFGRFSLDSLGTLTLTPRGGGVCLLHRRAVWKVGLLPQQLLHVRLLTPYDGFCTVEPGDVWIAERVVS
jgi:hypothetical protein